MLVQATRLKAIGICCPSNALSYTPGNILWRGSSPTKDTMVNLEVRFYSGYRVSSPRPWYVRYNPFQYYVFESQDSLIRIRGYVAFFTRNLIGMEFTYRTRNGGEKSSFIGQRAHHPFDMIIDGSGGEYISEVRVCEPFVIGGPYRYRKPSQLSLSVETVLTWQIHTNRGRSCMFAALNPGQLEFQEVESRYAPKPGEYIAGIVWGNGACDRDVSFWNFGIICRRLP